MAEPLIFLGAKNRRNMTQRRMADLPEEMTIEVIETEELSIEGEDQTVRKMTIERKGEKEAGVEATRKARSSASQEEAGVNH